MSKKTLILISCLVLSLALGLGGSLAYLTDTDTRVNTFTMGDVDIEVEEAFGDGDNKEPIRPGAEVNKDAKIVNTGTNDAYVWMTVSVPSELDGVITLNWTDDARYPEGHIDSIVKNVQGDDGKTYTVYTVLVDRIIAAGQETPYLLDSVTMSDKVDFENGQYYLMTGGTKTEIDYDLSSFDVIVTGYAIQADGFATVKAAYEAYGQQWGNQQLETDNTPEYVAPAEIVNGVVTVPAGEKRMLTGAYAGSIEVQGAGTLYLRDLKTIASESGHAIQLDEGSSVKLVVEGNVTLTGAAGGNGIYVPAGTTLDLSGTGTLKAVGSAGSDTENGADGIGGEGTISIHDLNGLTAEGWGLHGFGIGGASASITIKNTNIAYVKGGYVQKEFVNDTSYGKSEPEGGAAIGSSVDGAVITLENVTITNAEGGSKGAGIGAQYWTGVTINIDGCNIKRVVGGNASAGIGGSRVDEDDLADQDVTININNSTINAEGGQFAAGIGSGYDTNCTLVGSFPMHTINITGNSVITAQGGKYGAGIGTGYHVGGLAGKIENSVTVNATAGEARTDKYVDAMAVGFGEVDMEKEGKDNRCEFDFKGHIIKLN